MNVITAFCSPFYLLLSSGHFLGNGSLIELLQKRGYDIQHTPPGEPINNHNSWVRLLHVRQFNQSLQLTETGQARLTASLTNDGTGFIRSSFTLALFHLATWYSLRMWQWWLQDYSQLCWWILVKFCEDAGKNTEIVHRILVVIHFRTSIFSWNNFCLPRPTALFDISAGWRH